MAKKKKKQQKGLLLRCLIAAVAAAALIVGLVFLLKPPPPSKEPPVLQGQVPGIDVSSHQGQIDWEKVADSGIQFAIVRLGYRSYGDGTLHTDQRAKENLAGARAAGLKVGAYFFSQAVTEAEAETEAALALGILGDFQLDLPLAYDWEYVSEAARTGDLEGAQLINCVHAFCETVEAGGEEPMVYFNQDLANTRLDLSEIEEYPFWLAQYAESLDFPAKVTFWQHSDQGKIQGIEENVDLNWYWPE
ncbi:MAG: glycoside hydrolase family 25 protein [Oscillospiraceae bacterium]|nr:glycoside hydrolase family 25 protein [Oscillospiraceae bacterium]